MPERQAHQWWLVIEKAAKQQFDTLSRSERQGIFRVLQQLLEADNPYAMPGIEMLKDSKFASLRKFRAGDYRIFFAVKSAEVIRFNHAYRGTLVLAAIRHRSKAY